MEVSEEIMTFEFWEEYFGRYCVFELESKEFLDCDKIGKTKMMFTFTRVDGQAKSCHQAICRDRLFCGEVSVQFGGDPCDEGAH